MSEVGRLEKREMVVYKNGGMDEAGWNGGRKGTSGGNQGDP